MQRNSENIWSTISKKLTHTSFLTYEMKTIKSEFNRSVVRTKGEIEAWSEQGSGWVLDRIVAAYVEGPQ